MKYSIPSPTETICLTQTQLEAVKYPSREKIHRIPWKDIPGERVANIKEFSPNHFISDHGRVKVIGEGTSYELKGNKNHNGRHIKIFTPKINQKQISRLVLKYFGDPVKEPIRGLIAVHLDGDTENDHITNLKWMTRSEYRQYTGIIDTKKKFEKYTTRTGKKATRRVRYSAKDISEMSRLSDAGVNIPRIAEIFHTQPVVITYNIKKFKKQNP